MIRIRLAPSTVLAMIGLIAISSCDPCDPCDGGLDRRDTAGVSVALPAGVADTAALD
jgi:hypothetical protein